MKTTIRRFWQRPFGRYVLIGGAAYVLELAIIILTQSAGASSLVAVALSFWIGLSVSFGLQKLVTFGDWRWQYQVLSRQFALYSLLVIWNFGFTLLVTSALSGQLPATFCRTVALGVTTIWNFYLYKTRIFQRSVVRETT